MPFKARRPAGGFRVMYEYANRLSDLGYDVHITYPLNTRYMEYRLPYIVRYLLTYIEGFRTSRWFDFRPKISMSYANSLKDQNVRDSDIIIATWWATALEMGALKNSKGKKINLIQGYENWTGHEDELHASYNMEGVTNIVVASYLKEIVEKYTENSTFLIPNAIDKDKYRVLESIEGRRSASICMLYSIQEIKGSIYGLEALVQVKEKYPELTVDLFGICPEPDNLPDWITFYRDPKDLCSIYNRNAIFISNSLTEGMALTPMEAMFCGCAAILTDIKGHEEYGKDNETALLYKAKDSNELANKIISLIVNNENRVSLAERGNSFIQQFSWDVAVDKMDKIVKNLVQN
ncbi:glycosyltransferase involved in cell wall biosynthesis [Dysgonomonas alginatilytica]|uniref:Glycosyltransferase involved in cell wall biosynthesis n=1 Tax=Dysgonomonas alginatilytica TaxID=1605892 RepID=A0A2V3PJR0_9BACT|nr:glycosyltransferase family 4 protein [Dysgonomonas alginatilytica]PXV60961.1 glycosyltransferase involved in cell wall biosynthesis [Dysgonomonas alginatilytica]